MGLFGQNPESSAPYPAADQGAYANEQYAPPQPTLPRTDSSFAHQLRTYRPPPRQAAPILTKLPGKDTEHMAMLLHMSQTIERTPWWNILAAGFTWMLLAGFIVLPGTYTDFQSNIQKSDIIKAAEEDQSNVGNKILTSIANVGLLGVAVALCAIGAAGIVTLLVWWRKNYIWIINKVLM